VGRNGSLRHPAGLGRSSLQSSVRPGDDPCAAIQVLVHLEPGESDEVVFLLGQDEDRDAALETLRQYRSSEACDRAWDDLQVLWDDVLGAVTVQTPEPSMDLLLNRWLLYQALSSRIWGRSGLYQSSGAYGYRDQLQDVMSLVHTRPDLAREQILRAARHQFEEGDVLHWWHPPSGRGVRTRISDDLLWLPLVTTHYIDITGDTDILDEKMPFLRGDPLQDSEEDRYDQYPATEQEYSLFEHCRRAVERGHTKGEHGLPLMGGGDWNDGMNRVGIHGRGESVWMGWFLYVVLRRFAALCAGRQEHAMCEDYDERADRLLEAIEEGGWDGAWYRRAYYDDGTPLGSRENVECQIDSLSQSWAVLSRTFAGEDLPEDRERIRQAMEAVDERLVREQDRLVLLFTPPFDQTPRDPGYIKGYLPGIRENGGQYTHAALWTIWAFAELGEGERAEELFRMINPILRMDNRRNLGIYQVEPYVIAADVYGCAPHVGRGGWTWYTGSASWMYRLGLEGLLGLNRQGNRLWFTPHVPEKWGSYQIAYRYGKATYRIAVTLGAGEAGLWLDGRRLSDRYVTLEDDGDEHDVQVHVARAATTS
jgi:cyclic beta-1,2-glucan synthetase